MNVTASETNYVKKIENATLLFKNDNMYLNQKYYLSPVGDKKANSFEVFPLHGSKIFLYHKESQLEDAVLNFLTNFLLYLSIILFETLYAKWVSRPTSPIHFFKKDRRIPECPSEKFHETKSENRNGMNKLKSNCSTKMGTATMSPTKREVKKPIFVKRSVSPRQDANNCEDSKVQIVNCINEPKMKFSKQKISKEPGKPKFKQKTQKTQLVRRLDLVPKRKKKPVKEYFINNISVEINENCSNNKIILIPKIKKKRQYMLLDSGAEISCASYETYKYWQENKMIDRKVMNANPINIRDAQHGTMTQSTEPVIVTLDFNGKMIQQQFRIIDNLSHTLLGVDFMKTHSVSLHVTPEKVHIEFSNSQHPIIFKGHYPDNIGLTATYSEFLNPGINELTLEAPYAENTILHVETLLDDNHPIQFKEGIAKVIGHEVKLVFINKADVSYPIPDISKFVKAKPLENNVLISRVSTSTTTEKGIERAFDKEQDDFKDILKPEMEEDENLEPRGMEIDLEENYPPVDIAYHVKRLFPEQFHNIMIEFFTTECPDLIARHSYDSGTLREDILVIKDFNLRPGAVVRCKPLILDHIRQQQLNRALEIMVKAGILVKGVSSMYSPAFIISKADGRIRVVISYVEFNKNIEQLNYVIPDTRQVLLEIGKAKPEYISQIDYAAAYSAVKVTGEASKQAAICTQTDTYLLKKLLFGISTSPGMFNYAISKIIETIDQSKRKFVSHFFDDVTIYSGIWPESNMTKEEVHLKCIKDVLKAVHASGMKINLSKCSFFKEKVNILGRTVSKHGMSPAQKTVDAIQKLQPPTNLKQLQSIIGTLVYTHTFVLNFSFHMEPLFKLLGKDSKIKWKEEQQKALDHFKEKVTTKCINYWPRYDKKVYIAADASTNCVGAVIYQTRTLPRDFKVLRQELTGNEPLSEEDEKDIAILPKPRSKCPRVFTLNRFDNQLHHYKEMNIPIDIDQDIKNSEEIHVCLPIAFHSQALGVTRSRWTIMEKECYAICSVIDKYEHMLKPFNEVYVLSDSAPLLFVAKGSQAGVKKLQRWICRLSQCNFTIFCCSISSKQNIIADLLSRNIFWHIPEKDEKEKFNPKKVLVKSPFKFNSLITIKDIITALKENPNCVYTAEPKMTTLKNIYIESIGYIGTRIVEDLTKQFTDQQIQKSQEKDQYCQEIKENLQNNKMFYVLNNILYRKQNKTDSIYKKGRAVLTKVNVIPCIVLYHYDNHSGIQDIYNKVNEDYFYPNLYTKVIELVAACHLCSCFKAHPTNQKIHKLPFWPIEKNYVWHCDVTGGFPIVNGYKSILVIQEYYTKFKIFNALKEETAREIGKILEDRVFTIFGPCKYLSTDNAMNLVKALRIQKLLKKYNILPHLMTAYHPESHGVIEICCRSVQTLLRLLNARFKETWPHLLGLTQIMLNNKKNAALGGKTSSYCMFGYDIDIKTALRGLECRYRDYNQLESDWEEIREQMDEIITKWMDERNKRNQKLGGKLRRHPPGTWVYVRDHTTGAKRKLRTRWIKAPLYVLNEFDSVLLVKSFQGVIYSVHKSNCHPMKSFQKADYEQLPSIVKANLGVAYTNKELQDLMERNEIPKIFQGKDLPYLTKAKFGMQTEEEALENPEPLADQIDPDGILTNDDVVNVENPILQQIGEEDEDLFQLPTEGVDNDRIVVVPDGNQLETIPEEVEPLETDDLEEQKEVEIGNETLGDERDDENQLESRSNVYSLRRNPRPKPKFDL